MRRRLALAFACALAVAGFIQAADEKPPVKYEIPFRLIDTKHVLVRAKINGKGPFNLIMDTGAPAVFITKAVAKKANAKIDGKGWANFDTFELEGGLKVPKPRGRVEDLFQLDGMNGLGIAGVELHGVIGYNVLAKYRIQYDFTSDKLVMEELPGFEPPALVPLGVKGAGGLQAMGPLLKTLVALLGIKPNFEIVPRGFIGLLSEDDGVTVKSVFAGSPAAKAGLKPGDRIITVRDTDVSDGKELAAALAKAGVGTKIPLTVKRGEKMETFQLKLGRGL